MSYPYDILKVVGYKILEVRYVVVVRRTYGQCLGLSTSYHYNVLKVFDYKILEVRYVVVIRRTQG
jgi:hypothetical protein